MSGKGWKRHLLFDRTNVVFQGFYFFFLSAFMKLVYLPIYLKQLGLSASYAGILLGVIPFARGVGASILGYVADETNSRKLVFLVSLVSHILAPVLLLIPRPSEPECQSRVTMETPKHFYNRTWMEKSLNKISHQEDTGQSQELLQIFFILLVLFLFTEFIAAPAKNLADSALLENLDSTESTNYGKFRMWGNVARIILCFIVSPVAKSNTVRVCGVIQDDYGLTMFPFSTMLLVAFTMGLMIDFKQDELRTTNKRKIHAASSLKDVLLNLDNIAFISIILYFGIVDGVFYNFMFWNLTDIDASQATWVVGVAEASRNIACAFAFGSSGILIRKLGVLNTVNLSLVIYVVAFIIYGLLRNPWLAIIPEVMQFFAFGVSMPACIVYFKERTPEEYSATTQGIVFSCYLGIGVGLGSMIGGFLVDIIGGSSTFLLSGGVTAIVLLLCVLSLAITTLLDRIKNNKMEKKQRIMSRVRETLAVHSMKYFSEVIIQPFLREEKNKTSSFDCTLSLFHSKEQQSEGPGAESTILIGARI